MTFQRTARYSPDNEMYICETEEQVKELESRGWSVVCKDFNKTVWVEEFPKKRRKKNAEIH